MLSSRCDVHVEPDVRIIIWDVIQGMIRADKFGVRFTKSIVTIWQAKFDLSLLVWRQNA